MTADEWPASTPHGTPRGYDRHVRLGIPSCAPCRAARAEYQRAWRQGQRDESAAASRRYDAARLRALTRLGKAYPEHYAALLREELTR